MGQTVNAPSITPAKGGLLARAAILGDVKRLPSEGVDYEAPPWGVPAILPSPLVDGDWDRTQPRSGVPFTIYRAVESSVFEREGLASIGRTVFTAGESVAVETQLQPLMNTAAAANDLTPTPGTAISPDRALGLLEQFMGANYAGLPMLHTNRRGAAILGARRLVWPVGDGLLDTVQGTPTVNGAGYSSATGPNAVSAGATDFWIYATGQVNLWQGPVIEVPVFESEYNQERVLLQRQYVPVLETPVAAVLASML